MKQTILIFSFFLFIFLSSGQILRSPDLYYDSGITKVERRGFNEGGIGKDYWSLYTIDSTGRVVEKKSFKKASPLFTTHYRYNDNYDATSIVSINDMTDPLKYDTVQYYYEYSNGKIVIQREMSPKGDSTIYRMIENEGDSILTYEVSRHHYSSDRKANHQVNGTLTLTYYNNLLTKIERVGIDGSKYITMYEYFENGDMKRRVMKIFSTSNLKQMLVGAPGADDQTYQYSYDQRGRIRNYYLIRNNKKHKLATYHYE